MCLNLLHFSVSLFKKLDVFEFLVVCSEICCYYGNVCANLLEHYSALFSTLSLYSVCLVCRIHFASSLYLLFVTVFTFQMFYLQPRNGIKLL